MNVGNIILCRYHDVPPFNQHLVAEVVSHPQNHSPNWMDVRPLGSDRIIAVRGAECDIKEGDCSGKWIVEKIDVINGQQCAKALAEQGSDPEFFMLTAEGEDSDMIEAFKAP